MQNEPSYIFESPAKINLWLKILGKRSDGFHDLNSRMAPLALHDVLTFRPSIDVQLSCSDATLVTDESNLVMKALRGFERRSGLSCKWQIHLEKRIPHGAGMGGGSSNAATVLRALNQLHDYPLSSVILHEIAATLGSDVNFFLDGGFCDVEGRGESIQPLQDIPILWPVLLIKPAFSIATPWAFQRYASAKALLQVDAGAQSFAGLQFINDLERPVFEKWVWLPVVKQWLLSQPQTQVAMMSGSGSTLFALVNNDQDLMKLKQATEQFCGSSTWICATHLVHKPYQRI